MYNAIKETISVIYETSAAKGFFFYPFPFFGRGCDASPLPHKKKVEKAGARVSMCFFNVEGSVDEWERSVAVVDNRRHEFFGTTRVPLAVFLSRDTMQLH